VICYVRQVYFSNQPAQRALGCGHGGHEIKENHNLRLNCFKKQACNSSREAAAGTLLFASHVRRHSCAQYLEHEAAAVNVAFNRHEWTSGEAKAPQQKNG
jgi:hypothetical protein